MDDRRVDQALLPAPATAVTRTCRSCTLRFTVTREEWAFLEEVARRRGWPRVWAPSHCQACRQFHRQEHYPVAVADGQDEVIACVVCGRGFTWQAGEKRYYAERGYLRPRRCLTCRVQAREQLRLP